MSVGSSLRGDGKTRAIGLAVAAAFAALLTILGAGTAQALESSFQKQFDPDGEQTMAWVQHVDVGPDGNVYLSDANNGGSTYWSTIRKFDANLEPAGQFGTYGFDPENIRAPKDLHIDDDGNIYVAVAASQGAAVRPTVKKFSPTGELLETYGQTNIGTGEAPPGEVRATSIAVDENDGSVYIGDSWNELISKFSSDGTYVTRFGGKGDGPGEFHKNLGQIAVSPDGNVHAINIKMDREEDMDFIRETVINEYEPDGTVVGSWGHGTDKWAQLGEANGLTFHDSGVALVTDNYAYNGPNAEGTADGLEMDTVKVFNEDKEMIHRFGNRSWNWDFDLDVRLQEGWFSPSGVALDQDGGVYVASTGDRSLVKWNLTASSPEVDGISPGSPAKTATPALSGSIEEGSTVSVFDNAECSGEPLATGSADEFAAGLPVPVPTDATTNLFAQATSFNGGDSACAADGIRFTNQTTVPDAPELTGSNPDDPADVNNPHILGTVDATESTVELYTNQSCSGTVAASVAAEQFNESGAQVSVADNSSTTFWGATSNAAGKSTCSTSSVTYGENTPIVEVCPPGQTGTPPNCVEPRVPQAKIQVGKVRTLKVRAGKKGKIRVPVKNVGDGGATGVKVCAKVNPKKKRKTVKVGKCATLGSIGAGAQKVAKIPVKMTRKAKGTAKVRITVRSTNGGDAGKNTRVRTVKKKKK